MEDGVTGLEKHHFCDFGWIEGFVRYFEDFHIFVIHAVGEDKVSVCTKSCNIVTKEVNMLWK
tara:strand:+ start:64 stop:249 length:186 start_codon:yes stop_codon:yes gene_type:complete